MVNGFDENTVKELKRILLTCLETNKSTKALLYLLDLETGDFVLTAYYGYLRIDKVFEKLEFDSPILRLIFRKRSGFLINDVSVYSEITELYKKYAIYNLAVIPIYYKDKIIGFVEERNRAGKAKYDRECLLSTEKVSKEVLEIVKSHYDSDKKKGQKKKNDYIQRSYKYFAVKFGSFQRYINDISSFFQNTSYMLGANIDYDLLALNINLADKSIILFYSHYLVEEATKIKLSNQLGDFFPFLGSGDNISTYYYVEKKELKTVEGLPETYYTLTIAEQPHFSVYFSAIRFSPEYYDGNDQLTLNRHGQVLSFYMSKIIREFKFSDTYIGLILNLLEVSKSSENFKLHSLNTAKYARAIAERMSDDLDFADEVTVAAILHDIGILLIDPKIMDRKDPLDTTDKEKIKAHTAVCMGFLSKIHLPETVKRMIKYHHERMDGKGYPDKLKGNEIPLGSRIIAVAEAFEVMVGKGSYKKSVTPQEALAEIIVQQGKQFDPDVVRVFEKLLIELKGKNKW
jgi:putative nucleotidyltransferase with HDIG domain